MQRRLIAASVLFLTVTLTGNVEAADGGLAPPGGAVTAPEPLIIVTTGIGLLTAALFGRRLR